RRAKGADRACDASRTNRIGRGTLRSRAVVGRAHGPVAAAGAGVRLLRRTKRVHQRRDKEEGSAGVRRARGAGGERAGRRRRAGRPGLRGGGPRQRDGRGRSVQGIGARISREHGGGSRAIVSRRRRARDQHEHRALASAARWWKLSRFANNVGRARLQAVRCHTRRRSSMTDAVLSGPPIADGSPATLAPEERRRIGQRLGAGLIGLGLLALGTVLMRVQPEQWQVGATLRGLAALVVAAPTLVNGVRGVVTGDTRRATDQLVAIAVLAAAATGDFVTATLIPLFLELGRLFEERSSLGARAAIDGIRALSARQAVRWRDGVEE